ncbi:hypothetical protein E2562_024720 [Oryza meyeriana var. granulata]|uniref:Uncharacterized protein n=1 Tax=Oryza meyeriana var. granulata TaxID=110450 RepID=A0A6G1D7A6_9ORYZ|nr:hypothetical protein E2562_024720 [Oryza meyeriana var. granulata]
MAPPPKAFVLFVLTLSVIFASVAAFHHHHHHGAEPGGGEGGGGGFFEVPWFGPPGGGGWGAGYGGAGGGGGGGYARHEMAPPSTVCMEKGPCYKKRLTCPEKCFKSFSFEGKHGGGGGGGGGCSFDCNKCKATC